jgi:hypothetical protein
MNIPRFGEGLLGTIFCLFLIQSSRSVLSTYRFTV